MSEVLATAWQLWVVENLLAGHPPPAVIDALAGQGVPEDVARAHLEEVLASDTFARLRARAWWGRHAERVSRLLLELPGPVEVEVLSRIQPAAFHARYWTRCRPVKLSRAFAETGAVQTWTLEGLRDRFPDATVQVSADRDRPVPRSLKEAAQRRVPFRDLIDRALGEPGDDLYLVARSGLLHDPAFASLRDDLAPLPALLDPELTARHTSVWIGPAGTRTVAHFDPHAAMLVQVQGSKQIRLAPPTVGALAEAADGWFTTRDLTDDDVADPVLTVELRPGEALFVPAGWWHEVDALAPSITLSFLGFRWPNDFHWLGPIR